MLPITATEFINALFITNSFLTYLLSLTCSLQAEAKNIVQAVTEVKHITTALKDIQENISVHHSKWSTVIEQMCDLAAIDPCLPCICAHQRNRSNTPAQIPCDYYRRVISIPLVDHLISELEQLLAVNVLEIKAAMTIVPPIVNASLTQS